MSAYLIQSETLTGIADAIREKTGETGTINVPDMASKISGITGGSSVGGGNKLAQIVDRTVTEITEEDLEGVTRIGDYAFCSSRLLSISIPSSVTSIGSFAFQSCASLKNVTIPSSVTSIGGHSFETCNNLPRIVIPNSVISIDDYAFRNCGTLAEVIFEENSQLTTIGSYNFSSCGKLTNITIPEGVTKIGNYALNSNYLMEWISFPSSLKEIGSYAMRSCQKMTTVTVKATTPPTLGTNALNGCDALEQIIVPIGCGDAYKSATNWSAYADIIVEEESSGGTESWLFQNEQITATPRYDLPVLEVSMSYTAFVDGEEIAASDNYDYVDFCTEDYRVWLRYAKVDGSWYFHPIDSQVQSGSVSIRINN